MAITRRPDRAGWWVRLKRAGKNIQRYGGETKRAAEALEYQLKQQWVPRSKHDLSTFIENTYWPNQKNHLSKRSLEREKGILAKHIYPFFEGPLHAITPQRIIEYVSQRRQQTNQKGIPLSGDTIRKELNILRHLLSMAVRMDLIAASPFQKISSKDLPPLSPPRIRYLTSEEWLRVLARIPQIYRPVYIFLINTGCRRSEMIGLEWTNVDLRRGVAVISKDKRGREKVIPLHPTVLMTLEGLERKGQRVFWMAQNPDWVSEVFRQAVKAAEIIDFKLHDLRHTFASLHALGGTNLLTIQHLLGHNDPRMTSRYAHLSLEHLKEAIQDFNGFPGEKEKVN